MIQYEYVVRDTISTVKKYIMSGDLILIGEAMSLHTDLPSV